MPDGCAPTCGCYGRGVILGGVPYLHENACQCQAVYMGQHTGPEDAEPWIDMVVIGSEIDPTSGGPNANYTIRKPIYYQAPGSQRTAPCSIAGEIVHNIKAVTEPVHDWWI